MLRFFAQSACISVITSYTEAAVAFLNFHPKVLHY